MALTFGIQGSVLCITDPGRTKLVGAEVQEPHQSHAQPAAGSCAGMGGAPNLARSSEHVKRRLKLVNIIQPPSPGLWGAYPTKLREEVTKIAFPISLIAASAHGGSLP